MMKPVIPGSKKRKPAEAPPADAPVLVRPMSETPIQPTETQTENFWKKPTQKIETPAEPPATVNEATVNELQLWKPHPELIELTAQLAELNWPAADVAREIGVPLETFQMSVELVTAYNLGQAALKTLPTRRVNWRPTPNDIDTVKYWAGKGLTEIGVAAKMNISRDVFMLRMNDTFQMRDAFLQGNGEFHAGKIEKFHELVEMKDGALKYLTTPYIFTLKTGGMKDGSERQERHVEVNHTVTHKLKAPEQVKSIKDVQGMAAIEMARAKKISEKKMSEVTAAAEIIEAEITGD